MQIVRRDALKILGAAAGSVLPARDVLADLAVNYVDHYCYCGDILVSVGPEVALEIISTGDNFSNWASGSYRQVGPDLWVGKSYFTGVEAAYIRFNVDRKRYTIDYEGGGGAGGTARVSNAGRVVPGPLLGYPRGISVVAVYNWRRANSSIDADMDTRRVHASGMYRIKAIAEKDAAASKSAGTVGEYLATSTDLVPVSVDTLFDFISDGMTFGKWTWGRAPRTKVGPATFRSKSDYGGPDLFIRFDADRERKTVDYYVGQKPDALLLHQSARIFPGAQFDYDANSAMVTFTRWKSAGQSNYDWDRAVGNQLEDMRIAKLQLQQRARG